MRNIGFVSDEPISTPAPQTGGVENRGGAGTTSHMPLSRVAHILEDDSALETARSLFATVAVDQPLDTPYTYVVPSSLVPDIRVGSRVHVPLGRTNRLTPGTVLALTTQAPPPLKPRTEDLPEDDAGLFDKPQPETASAGGYKPIHSVSREVLPVPQDLLDLAQWLSAYYVCPIGMTLATMVPAAVKRGTKLPAHIMVHLAPNAAELAAATKLSPKSRALFEKLRDCLASGPRKEADLLESCATTRPALKRMVAKGLLKLERQLAFPLPDEVPANNIPALDLSEDQKNALSQLNPLLDDPKFAVRLVHGVTGSGKTELYIRAIEKIVAQGKRAIVLVPEISLTPQTVKRFTQRFPRVAVLHSGLRDTQRHQHWHAIASGWAQVIVGARSAIFAPVSNLGLIVVDEEHDSSYKQDNAPKYHGRDVAIRRAQMLNVPILLGSATPALESWHNATGPNARYGLLSLTSRPTGTQMPRVVVVDMKQQTKERRGLHILSTTLEYSLKQTLEKNKQAIFLLNRRGYAHYVTCPRCEWVLMCDNCDATMVVHRTKEGSGLRGQGSEENPQSSALSPQSSFASRYGKVQCHYCLTNMLLPQACPQCKAKLTHLGQGTQRAEDELKRKFPNLRLARMDSDSMQNAADYHDTLDRFAKGDLDLLIGTQMIAKGLDFPNVELVGVLNADLAMTMPDFRAAERTFQLICQVAGRSGRSTERGTVVVQTYQPHEAAIAHACNHDYLGFVSSELPHRQEFGYPPFGRMARILFAHKGFTKVKTAAEEVARLVEALVQRHNLPIRWLGPQPPSMGRLVELYRFELILFSTTAGPLQRLLAALRARGVFSGAAQHVPVTVDVDPVNMM